MEKTELNSEEIAVKLSNKFREEAPEWHNMMKTFFSSEDFHKVIGTLINLVEENKRFTPPIKTMFKAFEECPLPTLKVIVVGQDPYPQLGVADGIAFSCSQTPKKEASLRYIHDAVANTVYENKVDPKNMSRDLKHWANQGVLMLNTSLTTEVGKIGMHLEIWKPFVGYLFDMLNASKDEYVYIFLGKKAEAFEDLISDKHDKLFASHPASAAYAKAKQWDCNDVFNKANDILESKGKGKIVW
jgi:uracil-DNA glycosylase